MQPINYPAQPIATQHQITLHGETIQYTARVGFMPIHQATSGVTEGHLFYVYYSKNGVTDKSKRPVWFLFNGGPGAATVWLHMGAFGPKMVKMDPNGLATPPPYTYVDNPNCLLDTGDLVFIDAMGTGFSRPDQPALRPRFWRRGERSGGLRRVHPQLPERVQPVGIAALCRRRKLRHHARGGTGRLPDRPRHSDQRRDAALGGHRRPTPARASSASCSTLPTEIMTAHYHKKLPPDLQKLTVEQMAKQAREFASGEYLEYLFDGARATAGPARTRC